MQISLFPSSVMALIIVTCAGVILPLSMSAVWELQSVLHFYKYNSLAAHDS